MSKIKLLENVQFYSPKWHFSSDDSALAFCINELGASFREGSFFKKIHFGELSGSTLYLIADEVNAPSLASFLLPFGAQIDGGFLYCSSEAVGIWQDGALLHIASFKGVGDIFASLDVARSLGVQIGAIYCDFEFESIANLRRPLRELVDLVDLEELYKKKRELFFIPRSYAFLTYGALFLAALIAGLAFIYIYFSPKEETRQKEVKIAQTRYVPSYVVIADIFALDGIKIREISRSGDNFNVHFCASNKERLLELKDEVKNIFLRYKIEGVFKESSDLCLKSESSKSENEKSEDEANN
ncbi:MAG: hypothetical protein E7K04_02765 [Helicobacter sp.]|nr:hypothetical protein [Helicobacter sp.]